MGRNLSNYETVKQRKFRFYNDFKDGRIIVELLNPGNLMEHVLFKALVYKTGEDLERGLPLSIGYAHEIRDKDLKQGKNGMYESVNYTSWVENCEESAVGRALDNGGFASNMQCSREEIEKADRNKEAIQNNEKIEKSQGMRKAVTPSDKQKKFYFELLNKFYKGNIPPKDIEDAKKFDVKAMSDAIGELKTELGME